MYRTGLKKWVIQKSFFSLSVNFSDKTFIGIDEVLEDTIAPSLRFLNIFEYMSCFISILSTTASTIQSASLTVSKSSLILPTFILFIFDLSMSKGGLDLWILSRAFSLISVFKSKSVTGISALHK